jgi:CSLREA domain-containing protein
MVVAALAAPSAHAATFNVTIFDDAHELDPGDGVCTTKPPGCSLRAAIEEANAFAGRDQINVPAGTYELATGLPLTVSSDVLILGASARTVGIRMAGNFETGVPFDRVFDFTTNARASLRRLTILNGRADGRNNHFGGDIRNAGQLSLNEVTVADGVANSGGGLANVGGTVNIQNSTFTGNRAPADTGAGGDAGAILNFGEAGNPASLTIQTSTISANFARLTGGIFSWGNAGNTVVVKNSTIALNQSGNRGGGGGLGVIDGTATLENTIVSNNSSPSDPMHPNCSGAIASLGHNLEHALDCGFTATGDIQGEDPALGKLGNYGGETDTHSLGPRSPALDRANNAVCLAADQRGFFRPQGGVCDIGAFELDQAPNTSFTGGPADPTPTNDTTPTFTFTSDEPGTFACSVDGGAFATCTSPFTTPALAPGAHTLDVQATDLTENVDPTPARRSFTIDLTPPDTAFTGGPANPTPTNDSTPTFTFSSPDATATFQCSVDNAAFAACTSPRTTAVLGEGAHNIRVRAVDTAGNIDATPALRNFTIDLTPPDTAITGGPVDPTPTKDSTPTFTFNSPDATATFQCSVDNAAFVTCTSPRTTAALADGPHNIRVRALDTAGNLDATPAIRNFTVETSAPDTTITSGPAGLTNDSTPSFGFESNEPASIFQCRIDSAAFAPCTSPYVPPAPLGDGAHTFDVVATDPAGNADPSAASRAFTVDTAPPETTIDSGPPELTTDSTPTFAFSSDDPGATFECSLDSGPFAACTSPFTTPPLDSGPHTFVVRAIDASGNVDPSPALGFDTAAAMKQFTLLGAAAGPPVFAASFNVEAVSGDIFVSVPVPPTASRARIARARASQAPPDYQSPINGRVFVPLEEVRQLPVGSFVDTRYGTVRLESARNRKGRTQAGRFTAGVFKVLQSRRRAKGITDLQLNGGAFRACRARSGDSSAVAAGLSRRAIRRLRSSARGRFRTSGRNSSATVRGTVWEVIDRCDGTLTKVRRGKVAVRDFRLKRNVLVRAGRTYLARARR